MDLVLPQDLNHRYQSYVRAYDKGKMDGFDTIEDFRQQSPGVHATRINTPIRTQIRRFGTIAEEYTLAEHMYHDARQQQFCGPSGFDTGQHADRFEREAIVTIPQEPRGAATHHGYEDRSLIAQTERRKVALARSVHERFSVIV